MEKYYTPELEEFHVDFEYEVFETKLKESYKDKNNNFVIPNFKLYSKEYFNELHLNDKYWEYRKWKEKICDKNTVFNFSSTIFIEKYTPLNIKNVIRVKYLDQEDIESLGFKYTSKTVGLWFKKEGFFDTPGGRHRLTKYELIYFPNNNELHIEGFLGNDSEGKLFEGIIKNKSELKKLLKQLNIK
jgi:hypothetical protein